MIRTLLYAALFRIREKIRDRWNARQELRVGPFSIKRPGRKG